MARRRSRSTSSDRDREVGDAVEADCVARAASGDEGAFRALVVAYQDQVYGVAFRMMKDADLATEVAQDAFIKAFRGLKKFESRSLFSTWLYRITVNVCYDKLSRRSEGPLVPLQDLVEQGLEPAAGPAWSNDGGLEWDQGAKAFEVAIAELPETYRLPFVLRQVEEKTYREISEILRITETNAKVRVHRARETLLKRLRDMGVL